MEHSESIEERRAIDDASLTAFRHPAESMDHAVQAARAKVDAETVEALADVLRPLFLFISKGRLGGTMDVRAWVVLHETRLDLIGNESIDAFAARRGISTTRVKAIVKEFRQAIPGYRSPVQKSEAHVAKLRESARANATTRGRTSTPPPGRESPSAAPHATGSAQGSLRTRET